MKSGVVIADTHWMQDTAPHWAWTLALKFMKDVKPDFIIHLGDCLDLSYISSFNANKPLLKEGFRVGKDLELFRKNMYLLKNIAEEVIVLEGNHDERLTRYAEEHPEMEGLTSIEGLDVVRNKTIEWYPLLQQPVKFNDLYLCHGWWTTMYAAKKHVEELSGNVLFGHTHKRHYWSKVQWATNKEISGWGLGCLSDLQPDYLTGKPSGWQYDLAVIEVDNSGDSRVNRVPIIDGKIIYNGATWKRK